MMPNNLPPVATAASEFQPHRGGSKLIAVLIGFLGLGAVTFAILWAAEYSTTQQATKNLKSSEASSYAAGQMDQKKADAEGAKIADESPYRAYDAPGFAGVFEIKFPKNWSASVTENESSSTQINFYASPGFVKTTAASNNSPDKPALNVQLVRTTATQYQIQFASKVKDGSLKSKPVTVSGLSATQYSGKFDDQFTGQLVVVGVRDKSLLIATHDDQYDSEFNQVVAQAHINP